MLHALNDIATSVSKGTKATEKAVQYFMHYAYSNPDAEIIYRASDMILQSDSDAAYLVAPKPEAEPMELHTVSSYDDLEFKDGERVQRMLEQVQEGDGP